MKPSYLIAIVVIAIAIAIIVSTAGDASTYATFGEAIALANDGSDKELHVAATLKKDEAGNPIGMQYNPVQDPNYFEFTVIDTEGGEMKVIYPKPKPADIDKSETIVLIGKMKNDKFVCKNIILKCPSKYQEGESALGGNS